MMRRFVLEGMLGVAAVSFLSGRLEAQPCAPGPPPVPSYVVTVLPGGLTSIVGNPGAVTVFSNSTPATVCFIGGGCTAFTDDDYTPPIPLPFPFRLFLQPVTSFRIDGNGFLTFGTPLCTQWVNTAIPSAASAGHVAPCWDDLIHAAITSQTSYEVSGPPGDRRVVIEWTDLMGWVGTCADTGTRRTFQAILYEAGNRIEFRYDPEIFVGGPAVSATVGIVSPSGLLAEDPTGLSPFVSPLPTNNYLFDPCEPCGSDQSVGLGCVALAGSSGGSPVSGNLGYTMTESGAPPGVPVFGILGVSNTAWLTIPLPLPLAAFGAAGGCSLGVSVDVVFLTGTSGSGAASVPLPVPAGFPPCAGTVYWQWVNISAAAPLTLATSNVLQIVTG